ncbi:fanconi anemia group j protein [Anaeramoeba flamelloides]|uniref:Fanconi anemia group j protein n=1 Tax=Anaeramoeba flamelloides TaxID=1746091 RepID=A0ABQ8XI40_9EUKA|nr:fanconi anemia group j protein [Anaeramoeba flamelloides]
MKSQVIHEFGKVKVYSPYKFYESQERISKAIIKSFSESENALLESPTGTGKSLAILCSSLSWLKNEKIKNRSFLKKKTKDHKEQEQEKEQEQVQEQEEQEEQEEEIKIKIEKGLEIDKGKESTKPIKNKRTKESGNSDEIAIIEEIKPKTKKEENVIKINKNENKKEQEKENEETDYNLYKAVGDNTNKILPKIYICSHTHLQIKQLARELKKTGFLPKMCTLGSRKQYCVNDEANKSENIALACSTLKRNKSCQYWMNFKKNSLNYARCDIHDSIWDIEDLQKWCKPKKICPYYVAFNLRDQADIIFSPYQYLIDPIVRNTMRFSLDGQLVIIDEAHNIENCARESFCLKIDLLDLWMVNQEFLRYEKLYQNKQQVKIFYYLRELIQKIQGFMKDSAGFLKTDRYGNKQAVWNENIIELFSKSGITLKKLKFLYYLYRALFKHSGKNITRLPLVTNEDYKNNYIKPDLMPGDQEKSRDFQQNKQTMDKNGNQIGAILLENDNNEDEGKKEKEIEKEIKIKIENEIKIKIEIEKDEDEDEDDEEKEKNEEGQNHDDSKLPILSTKATFAFENIFNSIICALLNPKKFAVCLREFEIKNEKNTKSQNIDEKQTNTSLELNVWCLHPGLAMKSAFGNIKSLVLTSGTLSPMGCYEGELSLKFPTKLECNHVIDMKRQVLVGNIPEYQGSELKLTFQNSKSENTKRLLGNLIYEYCQNVPKGILVFFPSYSRLNSMRYFWQSNGTIARIKKLKYVFFEPKGSGKKFKTLIEKFQRQIRSNKKNGCIFFAVCRGKVSEGIDFSNDNARAVLILGIPFPSISDLEIQQKKLFNTKYQDRFNLISGGQWYLLQAFRATNQALGRCIRHKYDHGAIVLVDSRYQSGDFNYLTKWIRSDFNFWDNGKTALSSAQLFFKKLKENPINQPYHERIVPIVSRKRETGKWSKFQQSKRYRKNFKQEQPVQYQEFQKKKKLNNKWNGKKTKQNFFSWEKCGFTFSKKATTKKTVNNNKSQNNQNKLKLENNSQIQKHDTKNLKNSINNSKVGNSQKNSNYDNKNKNNHNNTITNNNNNNTNNNNNNNKNNKNNNKNNNNNNHDHNHNHNNNNNNTFYLIKEEKKNNLTPVNIKKDLVRPYTDHLSCLNCSKVFFSWNNKTQLKSKSFQFNGFNQFFWSLTNLNQDSLKIKLDPNKQKERTNSWNYFNISCFCGMKLGIKVGITDEICLFQSKIIKK